MSLNERLAKAFLPVIGGPNGDAYDLAEIAEKIFHRLQKAQHHGEPVAWQDPENGSRMCTAEHKAYALSKGGAAALALATLTRPLYPHADPGEVERLRLALSNTQALLDQANLHKEQRGKTIGALNTKLAELCGEVERLRAELETMTADRNSERGMKAAARLQRDEMTAIAKLRDNQLAERDALLEEAYRDGWNDGQEAIEQRYQTTPRTIADGWKLFQANNGLSASAEPTAPVERDERADFDTWFRKEKGLHPEASTTYIDAAFLPFRAWLARATLERKS